MLRISAFLKGQTDERKVPQQRDYLSPVLRENRAVHRLLNGESALSVHDSSTNSSTTAADP